MPLTDVERKITQSVVQRFLDKGESSAHIQLAIKFKPNGTNAVHRLVQLGVLRENNNDQLLPNIIAFQYCGDRDALYLAKSALELVIPALQQVFEGNPHSPVVSTIALNIIVAQNNPNVTAQAANLGLYLAHEMALLGGWSWDKKENQNLRLNERVINIDASAAWDNYLKDNAPLQLDENVPSNSQKPEPVPAPAESRKVFVVHGHDEGIKQTVARFLERLGLEAVILHEQPNKGRTVIEKFEQHADVGFAVVLMTPDDIAAAAVEPSKQKQRARQNVILELGYFFGKLGAHGYAQFMWKELSFLLTSTEFSTSRLTLRKAGV